MLAGSDVALEWVRNLELLIAYGKRSELPAPTQVRCSRAMYVCLCEHVDPDELAKSHGVEFVVIADEVLLGFTDGRRLRTAGAGAALTTFIDGSPYDEWGFL